MKDTKKLIKHLTVISFSCYLFLLLLGLPGLLAMIGLLDKMIGDAGSAGGVLMLVLAAIGSVYASVVAIPIVLCIIYAVKRKPAFPTLCIPFDITVVILNINFLTDAIEQKEPLISLFWGFVLLVSVIMTFAGIYRAILVKREKSRKE
jgi:hypothetical protein